MCKTLKLVWREGDYTDFKQTWQQMEGCKWKEVSLDGGNVFGAGQQMLLLEEPRGRTLQKKNPRRWSPRKS